MHVDFNQRNTNMCKSGVGHRKPQLRQASLSGWAMPPFRNFTFTIKMKSHVGLLGHR